MSDDAVAARRDEEGYLINPEDWTPALAETLAGEESITLTDEHWAVIDYVRNSYSEHGITPDIRHVARHLAQRNGCDKAGAKARIFVLFPYGYVRQTCKIAGMKRPRAWSTG